MARPSRLLNTEPLCNPSRDFFNGRKCLHPHFGALFNILHHGDRVDYFEDENLNAAASYVRLYEESKFWSDWIHVTIKEKSMNQFADAVSKDYGKTKVLPFSRWCESRKYKHRHLVVVSHPPDHFKKYLWDSVLKFAQGANTFESEELQFINSPADLVDILGFLSNPKSECPFQDYKKTFYLYKTLPVDYMLPLYVQWKDGLQELMNREWFGRKVSALKLIEGGGLKRLDSKWTQKIRKFYKFQSGLVLPLRKECGPTLEEGSFDFCFLTDGRKLYFRLFPEYVHLDKETWIKRQVHGGNCFYEAAVNEEDEWTPEDVVQGKLNLVLPLLRETRKLNLEKQYLKRKYKEMINIKDREIERLKKKKEV